MTAPSFVDFLQWSRRQYSDGQEFARLCLIFLGILFSAVMFVFFVNASYSVSHGGKSMDDDGNAGFVCSGCVVL